jgi:FkbM family methyltransferase
MLQHVLGAEVSYIRKLGLKVREPAFDDRKAVAAERAAVVEVLRAARKPAGETLKLDTGCLVALQPSVRFAFASRAWHAVGRGFTSGRPTLTWRMLGMDRDLIFDVGVNNGDDTAYYLSSGFRVVGIEANPEMIAVCEKRFREELKDGRLTLLNIAIADEDGAAEFHISEGNRAVWSSLDPHLAARTGLSTRRVRVPARRFRGLLQEFGVPYYLKVDIEGADYLCLRDIDSTLAPQYISFEASEGRIENLLWLAHAGYSRFKLIDQLSGFTQMMPPSMHSWSLARRIVRNLASERLRSVRGLSAAARRLRRFGSVRLNAQTPALFPISSSGPRPDESDGPWRSPEEILYAWLYYVRPTTSGSWYDVHATRECGSPR